MPAHPIHCQKCFETHWAFQRCDDLRPAAPPIEWGKSMEGARMFGDRTENFEVLGGQNLVLRKAKDG